jgi:serine/threonine protein kinase
MICPADISDAIAVARWQRVREVLADAIDCPIGTREAMLDARCADDRPLRRELDALLLAHDGDGLVDRLRPLLKPPSALLRHQVTNWSGRSVAHYRVQDPIGSGGMAVVYKGRDERLGRHVALKFLLPPLSAIPDARSQFVAEARAAAALDHPNVCTVYEIGETSDGQLFFAMPLYDGETLQARLDRGRLTFDEALPIALQVARGLGHAHQVGIVHRDVKPSNIVILPNGTAKILDFGIAQIHDVSVVSPHTFMGTVGYMSPEQASAGPVDCRSDIWSLGIVIHEMLSGTRPFEGGDGRAILDAILNQDPRLTATSHADVPAAIDDVLRRTLAKAPGHRYASMLLLAADLAALGVECGDVGA